VSRATSGVTGWALISMVAVAGRTVSAVPAENFVILDDKGVMRFALRKPIRHDAATQIPN